MNVFQRGVIVVTSPGLPHSYLLTEALTLFYKTVGMHFHKHSQYSFICGVSNRNALICTNVCPMSNLSDPRQSLIDRRMLKFLSALSVLRPPRLDNEDDNHLQLCALQSPLPMMPCCPHLQRCCIMNPPPINKQSIL